MTKEFLRDMLRLLASHRYIPDHVVRNFDIKTEYDSLRAKGMKSQEAQELLSEKHCTSVKNINKILYQLSKNGKYH